MVLEQPVLLIPLDRRKLRAFLGLLAPDAGDP